MNKTTVILSLVLLTSCSAKILTPSESDATRAATVFPGLTLDELNQGKEIFRTKCTQCHAAKRPTSWTETQWRKIVPVMAAKAIKSHKKEISGTERDLVLKYAIAMGQRRK